MDKRNPLFVGYGIGELTDFYYIYEWWRSDESEHARAVLMFSRDHQDKSYNDVGGSRAFCPSLYDSWDEAYRAICRHIGVDPQTYRPSMYEDDIYPWVVDGELMHGSKHWR